ncbi:MAG TPA: type II toxin-antitoxin system VapC family toxin [Acidobacteriota bacterium]|jgi:predicted nucleic acid-binding protein
MIHLDTTFLVDLLRETKSRKTGAAILFLSSRESEELGISIFVQCELCAGAELSTSPSQELVKIQRLCDALRVYYPDESFAPLYGRLLSGLERSGQRISTMDLLIATSALSAGARLVTRNARHFSRIPGLSIDTY